MGVASVWLAWQAPILAALAASLLLGGAAATRRPWLGRAATGAALLAGWAALAWRPMPWQLLLGPRGWEERLAAVGLAAFLAGLARPVLPARLGRWVPTALFLFAGAWLAAPLAGQGGYWRVLIGTAVGAWLLARLLADDPAAGSAAALAGWGALAALRSPWSQAALVPAAAAVAVWMGHALVGGSARRTGGPGSKAARAGKGRAAAARPRDVPSNVPGKVPGFPLAAGIAAASAAAALGAGRLPRGGFGMVDAAALAPVVAALILRVLGGRVGRLGQFATPAAAGAAAALAVAAAWLAGRLLRQG